MFREKHDYFIKKKHIHLFIYISVLNTLTIKLKLCYLFFCTHIFDRSYHLQTLTRHLLIVIIIIIIKTFGFVTIFSMRKDFTSVFFSAIWYKCEIMYLACVFYCEIIYQSHYYIFFEHSLKMTDKF